MANQATGQVVDLQYQKMPGQLGPLAAENILSGVEEVQVGYVKSNLVGPDSKEVFQIQGTWTGPAIATDQATLNGLPFSVLVRDHFEALIAAMNSPGSVIPARLNPTNSVNFRGFPPEIRNRIYKYHFEIGRPVNIVNGLHESNLWSVISHINACRLGTHTFLSQQQSHNPIRFNSVKLRAHCQEAFKSYTLPIEVPRSRLDLLLVNKQIYEEAMPMFYLINELRFDNISDAITAFHRMGLKRSEAVRTLSFSFETRMAHTNIPVLRRLVPNLERLGLTMSWDSRGIILKSDTSLSSAPGMKMLRLTFTNLTSLSLHGQDRIKLSGTTWKVCDVNDKNAVGPWLREAMVRKPPINDDDEDTQNNKVKGKKSKAKTK